MVELQKMLHITPHQSEFQVHGRSHDHCIAETPYFMGTHCTQALD